MRLRPIALLLLLVLSLRLGAGPHPCHAMSGAMMSGAMTSEKMAPGSCHGAGHAPKVPLPGEGDCCKGNHALCESACQTAGVLQVALLSPTALPFLAQAASPVDRSLPLFVLAIDHVPLA
jgi:hypothetical protein